MMIKEKYVVVDLETTGTQFKSGDQIIQFAAVVIEGQQITDKYNFLINPQKELSSKIAELTGLTNAQLEQQPEFAHFAYQIQAVLDGAVFVAHNVNFDLPFLQSELHAAGINYVPQAAIDTVELAQILLPEAPSFKLADLTSYLNIQHLNPHQADSDALVTAQLFLYLQQQLLHLPQPTLQLLKHFTHSLIRQTGDFVELMIEQACKNPSKLPDYLINIQGLVFKKPQTVINNTPMNSKYPVTTAKKSTIFNQTIACRPQQMKMMNFIQRKVSQQTPLALVDAPTGMGKTLGYLFPLSYYLDQGKQVIIATSTKLLQQQLIQESLPLLERLRQRQYSATIINSAHNYLDLDNFYQVLRHNFGHRQTDLVKMRIIVWLTQTQTGELSELNLTNYQSDFFKLIVSNGHRQSGLFYEYDFWRRRWQNALQSDILITNHAYLLDNLDTKLWDNKRVLLIDEANNILQQSLKPQAHLIFRTLKDALKKISDILYQQRVTIRNFFNQTRFNSWTHDDLLALDADFNTAKQRLEFLEADLLSNYLKKQIPLSKRKSEMVLTLSSEQLHHRTVKSLNKLAQDLQAILARLTKLLQLYEVTKTNSLLTIEQIIYQLKIQYQVLWQQEHQLEQVLAGLSVWQPDTGLMVMMQDYSNWDSISLATQMFNQNTIVTKLQEKFRTTIFIGAALQYHHSFRNFCQQLGIKEKLPKKDYLILKRDYDLNQQLQVYLPRDVANPRNNPEFDNYLAHSIAQLLTNTTCKALIMFNSLATLQTAYQYLISTKISDQREILAQGITGSNQRIKKRFYLNPTAILLAANSFGEGLNLSAGELKLLVITRLPFEAPSNPLVQAKNNYWRQQGFNPFQVESLPTAVRRLKQEVGRLIRSPSDQGIIVILDDRIASTKYGERMYHELELPPYNNQLAISEIALQINMLLRTNF